MRKFKVIARFFIAFILAISIISTVLLYAVSKTILSRQYVLYSLEKVDYYTKVHELVENNFEKYIQQSGLNEEVLKNLVTVEQVEEDTKKMIVSIFEGLHEKVSTNALEEKLKSNINKSINIETLNEEQKKAIDEFVQQICLEYKMTISNSDYEVKINSIYTKIINMISIFKTVISIIIGISIFILILLCLRRPYKILTSIAISFMTSGLFLIIINFYINTKIKVQYISILNDIISTVIRNIAQDVLGSILKYGILFIITGLMLSCITNFIHKNNRYKTLMYDNTSKEK